MSFNNANTLSFDKPEIPGLCNGGTIWVPSPDDCTSPGNSSHSAGFPELALQPTSEPLVDWDAFSTFASTFDDCITRAMCDREMQQHTLLIDSYTNSNTAVQVMEMVSSWFVGRVVGETHFLGVASPSGAHAVVCFWLYGRCIRRLWERSQ